LQLFDFVAGDMEPLAQNPLCVRMVSQQMASADSVCANIEEGYGRGSSKEYRQFLVIARGSARETQGATVGFATGCPTSWWTNEPSFARKSFALFQPRSTRLAEPREMK